MLGAQGRGFALVDRPDVPKTPIVPAAILYDLANGGDKAWGDSPPYRDLGYAAAQAAGTDFALGSVGAGLGVVLGVVGVVGCHVHAVGGSVLHCLGIFFVVLNGAYTYVVYSILCVRDVNLAWYNSCYSANQIDIISQLPHTHLSPL